MRYRKPNIILLFCTSFLFGVFFIFTPFASKAQQDSLLKIEAQKGQKQILKTNPLPIMWGNIIGTAEYRLLYEMPVSLRQTLMLGVSYLGKGPFFTTLFALSDTSTNMQIHNQLMQLANEATVNGYRIQAMYKFYLSQSHLAPRGFYIGPHASYSIAKIDIASVDVYEKDTYYNINIFWGGQAVISSVALDFFMGLGYKHNLYEIYYNKQRVESGDIPSLTGNLKLSLGFNIGYAF